MSNRSNFPYPFPNFRPEDFTIPPSVVTTMQIEVDSLNRVVESLNRVLESVNGRLKYEEEFNRDICDKLGKVEKDKEWQQRKIWLLEEELRKSRKCEEELNRSLAEKVKKLENDNEIQQEKIWLLEEELRKSRKCGEELNRSLAEKVKKLENDNEMQQEKEGEEVGEWQRNAAGKICHLEKELALSRQSEEERNSRESRGRGERNREKDRDERERITEDVDERRKRNPETCLKRPRSTERNGSKEGEVAVKAVNISCSQSAPLPLHSPTVEVQSRPTSKKPLIGKRSRHTNRLVGVEAQRKGMEPNSDKNTKKKKKKSNGETAPAEQKRAEQNASCRVIQSSTQEAGAVAIAQEGASINLFDPLDLQPRLVDHGITKEEGEDTGYPNTVVSPANKSHQRVTVAMQGDGEVKEAPEE